MANGDKASPPRLDRLDIRILATLQGAGRMTNVDLADAVGLSPTPCLQRVKRLERAGYIRGYGAHLDLDRLCANVSVFTEITLRHHGREDFLRFERGVQDIKPILGAWLVAGGYDYLLHVVARDVQHYQTVIEAVLDRDVGVEKYFSYVAIRQVKRCQGFPLDDLLTESGA
jgi:DNA-binding Lrp family transcriptional regulator